MDEMEARRIARAFVAKAPCSDLKDLSPYLNAVGAKLRSEPLGDQESGYTMTKSNGQHVITVNSNECEERQRYSLCHEIAHVELGLPSNHTEVPAWAIVKRDENERLCDLFAAELLMPQKLYIAKMSTSEPSLSTLEHLASDFGVSFPAAASRFAALAGFPCAYVTMEHGRIRFAERSASLRAARAWIETRSAIPQLSVAYRLREAKRSDVETDEVSQDVWFKEWDSSETMSELARHYEQSDSTISILWFSKEVLPEKEFDRFGREVVDDGGLPELTGDLPWPGAKRKKR